MGRRSRRRTSTGTPAPRRDHQARVKVSDDVWTDFRAANRNSSVSIALGELVADQHVAKHGQMRKYRIALEYDAAIGAGLGRKRLWARAYSQRGRRDEHVLASPPRESRGALPSRLGYDAFTSCHAASKSCVPLAPR